MRLSQLQVGPVLLTKSDRGGSIRIGKRVFILRHPSDRPLFSERYGHVRVIRLGRGWRITIRKDDGIRWRIAYAKISPNSQPTEGEG